MRPKVPSAIGRYEIRRELGRGMMGVVYEAHDPVLGRDIALKVVQFAFSPSDEDRQSFEERFSSEARAAARLAHPGIVVVHDVGRDPDSGALFMALELLRGQTLDRRLKEGGALDWREALRIVQRVAEALHHAHASGVVHRDIKPANIMLPTEGDPKIMDFGVAKLDMSKRTASGQFLGTPLYMSPEQAHAHPVDGRSDLFSLGSVLYEMVTGRPAFAGDSLTKILIQVLSHEPDPATSLVADLPDSINHLLTRCLAKDRDHRYSSGRALADDAEDILAGRPPRGLTSSSNGPSSAPPTKELAKAASLSGPAVQPTPRPGARHLVVGAAAGILLAAALFGGAWFLRPADSPPAPVARRIAVEPPSAPGPLAAPSPNAQVAATQARLQIEFEHSLKSGSLLAWVDDELVVEEMLSAQATRKMGITFRKGRVSDAWEVTPGRHEVRIRVAWDGNVKTESIFTNFKAGQTYHLEAKLGSLGGLKKSLSLEWQ